MTLELGGFLALAALMIGLFAWLRTDARHMENRLNARLDRLEQGQPSPGILFFLPSIAPWGARVSQKPISAL